VGNFSEKGHGLSLMAQKLGIPEKRVKLRFSNFVYSFSWAIPTKLAKIFPQKGCDLGHMTLGDWNSQFGAMPPVAKLLWPSSF